MNELKTLQAEYKRLRDEARAVRAKAKQEEREISDEEYAQVEALLDQALEAKDRIEAIQDRTAQEGRLNALDDWARQPGPQVTAPPDPSAGQQPPAGDEPRRFQSFGHFLQAVVTAERTAGSRVDPRLLQPQAAAGLSEGIPSDGGFLVDAQVSNELLQETYETGLVASRCSRTPIGAGKNGLKVNGIAETSRADGSQWGGITAYWACEAEEKTPSKPKFRQIELDLKKLIGLCYATDELLEDAVALEAVIREGFPNVFGFKLDDAIIRGTGAGQPRGVLAGAVNAPRVRVAKETGQAATTIVAANVYKMYARMWARGLSNAVWFINQDVWPQIFQLAAVVGVGGVPLYIPPGGINQAPNGTLLGRPIVPIEQCATLGTEGDIIFGDFSQYKLIDKGGIEAASSIHVRFIYDETTFRFVLRTDGQPMWASSLTPAQGSNTVSPFVTLAAR